MEKVIIQPNSSHRGVSSHLDKSKFELSLSLLALQIPSSQITRFFSSLENYSLSLPRYKCIQTCSLQGHRLLLLHPLKGIVHANLSVMTEEGKNRNLKSLPTDLQSLISSLEISTSSSIQLVEYILNLNYDYWSFEEVMMAIFPEKVLPPSSFEIVGHIAHLNLSPDQLPYQYILGQVLIDKNKGITTVVNKLDSIDHTFRFFKMKVLAGDENLVTEQAEGGCTFQFDFSKVYWNSRLGTEHTRLVTTFLPHSNVVDVFGGVGPFAIPASKKLNCTVLCNDLNPDSFKWLQVNLKRNCVQDRVFPYNMDGHTFIESSISLLNSSELSNHLKEWRVKYELEGVTRLEKRKRKTISSTPPSLPLLPPTSVPTFVIPSTIPSIVTQETNSLKLVDHFVMNLPNSAIRFLSSFHSLLTPHFPILPPPSSPTLSLPKIHVYCFSKHPHDKVGDITSRIETVLGIDSLTPHLIQIHMVRKISPKKDMFCVSFQLPFQVAFGLTEKQNGDLEEESAEKSTSFLIDKAYQNYNIV